MNELQDKRCPICGELESDHDYEHLARECFPRRIESLEEACEAALAHLRYLRRMVGSKVSIKTIEMLEKAIQKAGGDTHDPHRR